MLKRTSKSARDCYGRAADCRRRAQDTADPKMREFWRRQETYWFRLAESEDLSARISTFLGARDARTFSPEAENGVEALVEIFDRVCVTLDLDLGNEAQPRTIARTLIKAAIDGESDPEKLFHVGLKAVSN